MWNIWFLSPLVPSKRDIFWAQSHLCLLLQKKVFYKSKHRWLCAQKIYKLRQTMLSQFVYFSLVFWEREETKTTFSALKPIWTRSNLLKTSRNKFKKHSVTKNCSDLSLFQQIVLVISKLFANSRTSDLHFKSFSRSLEFFFLTVGQNNFGNRIPFLSVSKATQKEQI